MGLSIWKCDVAENGWAMATATAVECLLLYVVYGDGVDQSLALYPRLTLTPCDGLGAGCLS